MTTEAAASLQAIANGDLPPSGKDSLIPVRKPSGRKTSANGAKENGAQVPEGDAVLERRVSDLEARMGRLETVARPVDTALASPPDSHSTSQTTSPLTAMGGHEVGVQPVSTKEALDYFINVTPDVVEWGASPDVDELEPGKTRNPMSEAEQKNVNEKWDKFIESHGFENVVEYADEYPALKKHLVRRDKEGREALEKLKQSDAGVSSTLDTQSPAEAKPKRTRTRKKPASETPAYVQPPEAAAQDGGDEGVIVDDSVGAAVAAADGGESEGDGSAAVADGAVQVEQVAEEQAVEGGETSSLAVPAESGLPPEELAALADRFAGLPEQATREKLIGGRLETETFNPQQEAKKLFGQLEEAKNSGDQARVSELSKQLSDLVEAHAPKPKEQDAAVAGSDQASVAPSQTGASDKGVDKDREVPPSGKPTAAANVTAVGTQQESVKKPPIWRRILGRGNDSTNTSVNLAYGSKYGENELDRHYFPEQKGDPIQVTAGDSGGREQPTKYWGPAGQPIPGSGRITGLGEIDPVKDFPRAPEKPKAENTETDQEPANVPVEASVVAPGDGSTQATSRNKIDTIIPPGKKIGHDDKRVIATSVPIDASITPKPLETVTTVKTLAPEDAAKGGEAEAQVELSTDAGDGAKAATASEAAKNGSAADALRAKNEREAQRVSDVLTKERAQNHNNTKSPGTNADADTLVMIEAARLLNERATLYLDGYLESDKKSSLGEYVKNDQERLVKAQEGLTGDELTNLKISFGRLTDLSINQAEAVLKKLTELSLA